MDTHVYVPGVNGLCDICGKTKEDCDNLELVWVTGQPQSSGQLVNKSIQFFEQIPETCKVFQIASTKVNSFILSYAGRIYSWGEMTNALGRALEKRDDAKIPKMIDQLRNVIIVSLSCGQDHVLALDSDGNVWSWGFNKYGQLGHGDAENKALPEKIDSLSNIVRISAGNNYSFAVSKFGNIYCWGDNRNYQLGQMVDEKGNKQNKFLSPREIEHTPWEKSPDIVTANGTKLSNFFYKSPFKVATGDMAGGPSRGENMQMKLEIEELKRKNELLNKKVHLLEEEISRKTNKTGVADYIGPDPVLYEMQDRFKKIKLDISVIDKKVNEKDLELSTMMREIQDIEMQIKDFDDKETVYWDEIEQRANDIRKLQISKADTARIAQLQEKKDSLQDLIRSISLTKSTYYNELTRKQDILSKSQDEKQVYQTQLDDLQKQESIFRQMISTREKDMERQMIENNKETVEEQLLNMVGINEALKDTTIRNIGKSVIQNDVKHFLEISNTILHKIQEEINSTKARSDLSIYKSLEKVWKIVEDNVKLRLEINTYIEGINIHTANKLTEFYDQNVEFEDKKVYQRNKMYTNAISYIKSVLLRARVPVRKGELDAFEDEMEERSFRRPKQTLSHRARNSWFCW
jgi:hypothetical protein